MTGSDFPEFFSKTAKQLTDDAPLPVRICGDMQDLAHDMANAMLADINSAQARGRALTMIAPVGPIDQFPLLAEMINQQGIDCRDVMIINMDEYLTDDKKWIDIGHPLSFRGYMQRKFYDLLEDKLAPSPENRVFPDPAKPQAVLRYISERGGVDVTYGGIGINGHIAFNEPDETADPDEFVTRPSRVIELTPHTRTINATTVGGDIEVIPTHAITVGMKEILGSARLRFYCNRQWQRAVVRRLLFGPITPACPASFLRTHGDANLTLADYVSEPPDIRLR